MNMALAGLVILALGDSHMAGRDYLLTNLHNQLEAQGASVHSYGMCGATAGDWLYPTTVSCGRGEHNDNSPPVTDRNKQAKTWNLNELIAKHHPNLVIVELGDTMASYGSPEMPKAWIYDQVRALVGRITGQGIACVWVGPIWGNEGPPYRKTVARVRELSQFLAQTVPPCHFVDSTSFAKPGEWPTTDGQHLTEAGYKAWGANIVAAIDRLKNQQALR
jgi:hypothetical protein